MADRPYRSLTEAYQEAREAYRAMSEQPTFTFRNQLVKVHRLEWRDYRFGPKLYLKALNGTELETTLIEFRDEAKTLPEEHLARILFDK